MALANCTLGFVFCPKSFDSLFFATHVSLVCQVVFISLLIVATLMGNALLCFAVYKTSSKLTASSIFILNLAIIDILVGTLVLPFWIFSTISLGWPLPGGVCEFIGFLTMTLMQCSIFSLSGIAVDRYLNISHPLRYPIEATLTRVSFVVLGIWIFCLCIASMPIYGWGDYRFQPQTVPICNPEYISEVSFTIFLIVFGMALPFAIMMFSYIRIIQIARGHIRKIDAMQTTLVARTSPQHQFLTVDTTASNPDSRSPSRTGQKPLLSKRFSMNVKAVRRVFIAVGKDRDTRTIRVSEMNRRVNKLVN